MAEQRNFDKDAGAWDDNPVRARLSNDIAAAIRAAVPLDRDMAALELGCGTGLLTMALQPLVHRIDAMDGSRGMLQVLEAKIARDGAANIHPHLVDLEAAALGQERYDLVASAMTLHHIQNVAGLLSRVCQACRSGGRIALADLDSDGGRFHADNKGVFHFGFDRGAVAAVAVATPVLSTSRPQRRRWCGDPTATSLRSFCSRGAVRKRLASWTFAAAGIPRNTMRCISMSESTYEIRLSRLPLLLLLCAGVFFLFAGLDIGFLHTLFPAFDVAPDKRWILYLFLLFFVGGGAAVTLQMASYLVNPPVMFRADPDGVAFGTGFRYRLQVIPWRYVETVSAGVDLSKVAAGISGVGLQIVFRQTTEIPGALATSIGVAYGGYQMSLSLVYMGRPLKEAVSVVQQMQKQYR